LSDQSPIIREMNISIELSDENSKRLAELARRLNVDVRDLAHAAIDDLISKPSDEFDRAANRVLRKNAELYRRLS
jgi:predicted transcriptional regulator